MHKIRKGYGIATLLNIIITPSIWLFKHFCLLDLQIGKAVSNKARTVQQC